VIGCGSFHSPREILSVVIISLKIAIRASKSGLIDDVALCGVHIPVEVFCPFERLWLRNFLIGRDDDAFAGG